MPRHLLPDPSQLTILIPVTAPPAPHRKPSPRAKGLIKTEQPPAVRGPRTVGMQHRVAGLFAGIGGIELGLGRHGHVSTLLCEKEPTALAVLRSRFPAVELSDDITRLTALPADTTMITAGFPCQDLSQAGKTAGIHGKNSGLVSNVFRLLEARRDEGRPIPWVLLENVSFMLSLARGAAFHHVIEQIEALGYRWAYRVVDSRAFGLPQRRERVYVLACLPDAGDPREVLFADDAGEPSAQPHVGRACGFYWTEGIRGLGWAVDAIPTLKGGSTIGIASPPAIWIPGAAVGTRIVTPEIRDGERLQGFPEDWTVAAGGARPGARWKLVGNAVSVDAAAWLGERLVTPGMYEGAEDVPIGVKARWPRAGWALEPGHRFAARVSSWPRQSAALALDAFLRHPSKPLSQRATAGFLSRTRVSTLRFPEGFIGAIEEHLAAVTEAVDAA